MDAPQIAEDIKKRLYELYGNAGPHDSSHILRAFNYCSVLDGRFTPRAQIMVLLHDVGNMRCVEKGKSFFEHAEESAVEAETILRKYEMDEAEIGVIAKAIKYHEFRQFEQMSLEPEVVELLKVQHNEYVDAIGMMGFIRQAQCSVELHESPEQYLENCRKLHTYYSGFEFHPILGRLEVMKRRNAERIMSDPQADADLINLYKLAQSKDNVTSGILTDLPRPFGPMLEVESYYIYKLLTTK